MPDHRHELIAPLLSREAEEYRTACNPEAEQHHCDPVGPDDCRGPEPQKIGTARTRRTDFFVAQRYWYPMLICERREVEWRLLAEPRPADGACVNGSARSLSMEIPSQLDAMTGEQIRRQLIAASTSWADEMCKH